MQQIPILDIRDLYLQFKAFGGTLKVLDGVNLKVWPREVIGVIGESGCGKTTTMKAVMKIHSQSNTKISKGEILFKDKDILKMKTEEIQQVRRTGISMIFQDPTAALCPIFTIGAHLRDVAKYSIGKEKFKREELNALIIDVLNKVMLPDPERILQNYPLQLSGGMRQRVCIAMNLINNNKNLLIADEPDTSLDVTIKEQILNLLSNLVHEQKLSLILISHALGSVRNIADRTYVMYAGSMIEVAETGELFSNPLHPYTQGLIAAVPKLIGGKMKGIDGSIPDYFRPSMGCRFHPRCKFRKSICEKEKPPFFVVNQEKKHEVSCWLFQK